MHYINIVRREPPVPKRDKKQETNRIDISANNVLHTVLLNLPTENDIKKFPAELTDQIKSKFQISEGYTLEYIIARICLNELQPPLSDLHDGIFSDIKLLEKNLFTLKSAILSLTINGELETLLEKHFVKS